MFRWYGGDFYNHSFGLRADTNWLLSGNWTLGGGVTFAQNYYDKDFINGAIGGYDFGLYLRPRYYINNRSFIMAGIGFDQNNTEIKAYGSDIHWGISASSGPDLHYLRVHRCDNKQVSRCAMVCD